MTVPYLILHFSSVYLNDNSCTGYIKKEVAQEGSASKCMKRALCCSGVFRCYFST